MTWPSPWPMPSIRRHCLVLYTCVYSASFLASQAIDRPSKPLQAPHDLEETDIANDAEWEQVTYEVDEREMVQRLFVHPSK
ncbi:hypothetical protein T440DRAFT_473043 [Plenodomus tracheiphilus IPT5]|uniref:Uncharacterized protein n=1 Tax=Plenodomus tracheiphilus IPT5 TaxID=1408161 RepID=A0A6A7ANN8_9PLEO|nr:hypothetical protein T440DRAFT_473043 [Plenodomus tracheiphilus IPT5]